MRYDVIYRLYEGVQLFLNVLSGILVLYALMSWFVRPDNKLYRLVARFCEPLLQPFRRLSRKLIERGLMIDISILLALLSIRLLGSLMYRLLTMMLR